MLLPLQAQLDTYDVGGIEAFYKFSVTIPKNDRSMTRCMIARGHYGEVRVVNVPEEGIDLPCELRDDFLCAVFRHVQRIMKRNGGTSVDWRTSDATRLLGATLDEHQMSAITDAMSKHITAESHFFEYSMTRIL